MTMFWRYINYLATWREHRKAIKQLNQLTNRCLLYTSDAADE